MDSNNDSNLDLNLIIEREPKIMQVDIPLRKVSKDFLFQSLIERRSNYLQINFSFVPCTSVKLLNLDI